MIKQKKNDLSSKFKVNEEIKVSGNVRIVGDGVESKVLSIDEARSIAENMGMDMILLNSTNPTPVIKLCNYEKMLYEMKKAAKKNKQSAKPLKEIQLSANIAKHDMETKANNARKFLEDGSRVRVVLTLKGREMARREENKRSILEFVVMLEDFAIPEAALRDDGNKTSVILKKRQ